MLDFIVTRRTEQLDEQAQIDKKLSSIPCQSLVAKYLFFQRQVNRDQCSKVKEGGILHTYTNIKQNLEHIEVDHQQINKILNSDNPCRELEKFLEHNAFSIK